MTAQEDKQSSVRSVTATQLPYNGDWHALFDLFRINKGPFNERMLSYINGKLGASYTNINDAMNALALANGATNFSALGTFNAFASLQAAVPTTLFDFDATNSSSYNGTGQTWSNLCVNTTDTYSLLSGGKYTSGTTSPVFTGSAGSPSAYFNLDGTQFFEIDLGKNKAFASEDWVNTQSWTPTRVTVAESGAAKPDILGKIFSITPDTANNTHFTFTTATQTNATQAHVTSVYVNKNTYRYVRLLQGGGGTTNFNSCFFDLELGVVATPANGGTGTGAAAGMVDVGGGWWRIWVSGTPTTTAGQSVRGYLYVANSITTQTFAGDGVSSILASGMQIEQAASVTTYTNSNGLSFFNDWHKVAGGSNWIACAVRISNQTSSRRLLGTQSSNGASSGFSIGVGSSESITLINGDNTTQQSGTNIETNLPVDTDAVIIVSRSSSAEDFPTIRSWVNAPSGREIERTFQDCIIDSTVPFRFGGTGNLLMETGTRLYALSGGTGFLTGQQARAIAQTYANRHNRTYGNFAPVISGVVVAGQSNAERLQQYAKNEYQTALNAVKTGNNILIDGATGGTYLVKSNAPTSSLSWWYDPATNTYGTPFELWKTAVQDFMQIGTIDAIYWAQGESEVDVYSLPAKIAEYKAAGTTLFAKMREIVGNVPVIVSPLGRRGDLDTAEHYQSIREIQRQWAAENAWIQIAPESINENTDGGPHLETPQGYYNYAPKVARKVASVLGVSLTGVNGPAITSATRIGTAVTVNIAHDSGTDFTPLTGIEGFRFFRNSDNLEFSITSAVRATATSISLTLASDPSGAGTLYYGYRALTSVTASNLVMDNATVSMPLRTATVSVL